MNKTAFVVLLLALVGLASARWSEHEFSPDVSAQVANAIKTKLYPKILSIG